MVSCAVDDIRREKDDGQTSSEVVLSGAETNPRTSGRPSQLPF